MFVMEIFNQIADICIKGVFAIIGVVVTSAFVPWLKNTFFPWLHEKRVYNIVKCLVQAAEKLGETGEIDKGDKRGYVIERLKLRGLMITPEIDALIESAVEELDIQLDTIYGVVLDEFVDDDDDVPFDDPDDCGCGSKCDECDEKDECGGCIECGREEVAKE